MRSAPTEAERRLWQILRGKRLAGFKFKRQQRIGHFIADFVCFGRRLVLEADGGQHSPGNDRSRDAYLRAQAFTVLHFWNNDILNNEEAVTESILNALNTPLPSPLPQGEREQEL